MFPYAGFRYYLLFQNKGIGEKAVATKQWTAGLATKEATAVEEPMWQELGMTELMKDPDAITTGMNWYRCVLIQVTGIHGINVCQYR